MDVTQTSSASSTASSSKSSSSADSNNYISSDFETFLKMLTTQMQNQDPLNPLDSTDFAVQLATFSSVEQQVQTNTLLGGLSSQLDVMGLSQLGGWIGAEARVSSPRTYSGEAITLYPDPPATADRTELVVTDEKGAEVYRGAIPVDSTAISWNGVNTAGNPVADGTYTFNLESYSYDSLIATDQLESYGTVSEVRMNDGAAVLVLDDGTEVAPEDVRAVRPPSS